MVKEDLVPRVWKTVSAADTDFADGLACAIYVGTTGDVKVTDANGNTPTFKSVPAGMILVGAFKRLWTTGTTASNFCVAWN